MDSLAIRFTPLSTITCLFDFSMIKWNDSQQLTSVHCFNKRVIKVNPIFIPETDIFCESGSHGQERILHHQQQIQGWTDSEEFSIPSSSNHWTRCLFNIIINNTVAQASYPKEQGSLIDLSDHPLKLLFGGHSNKCRLDESWISVAQSSRDLEQLLDMQYVHCNRTARICNDKFEVNHRDKITAECLGLYSADVTESHRLDNF